MKKFLSVTLTMITALLLAACSDTIENPSESSSNFSVTSAKTASVASEAYVTETAEIESNEDIDITEQTVSSQTSASATTTNKLLTHPNNTLLYEVGVDIEANKYIITCTQADYELHVEVFENVKDYNNYINTNRSTIGAERKAMEENALLDFYICEQEKHYVDLYDGNIVLMEYGMGVFNDIELEKNKLDKEEMWFDEISSPICSGVYFSNKDILPSKYIITCTNGSMNVVVFDNKEDYLNYQRSSRFTYGEENDAIEEFSSSNIYLYSGDYTTVDLGDKSVLMIDDREGKLEPFNDVSFPEKEKMQNNDILPTYAGTYFIGKSIPVDTYISTCNSTDWSFNIIVFENQDDYLNYYRTDRGTYGDEYKAFEKNALLDFVISEKESCCLILSDGMVLVVDDGIGVMERINPVWGT